TSPLASTIVPRLSPAPTAAIRSPSIATSAVRAGAPVPSTTVAPPRVQPPLSRDRPTPAPRAGGRPGRPPPGHTPAPPRPRAPRGPPGGEPLGERAGLGPADVDHEPRVEVQVGAHRGRPARKRPLQALEPRAVLGRLGVVVT